MENTPNVSNLPSNQINSQSQAQYNVVAKITSPPLPSKLPSKEDAIIFPIVENATNDDYLQALLEHVLPKQICFASRMSNARMCVYLDSKQSVNEYMQTSGYINVNNQRIEARRLVNPAKKLLLSNVNPVIPHHKIEKVLTEIYKLKLCSPVTYVKAGSSIQALQHVYSFRRSVYYSVDSLKDNIPDSFLISHDSEEYRIFTTTENTMICFHCKKNGHPAKSCPSINNTTDNSTSQINLNKKRPASSTTTESLNEAVEIENNEITDTQHIQSTTTENEKDKTPTTDRPPKKKKARQNAQKKPLNLTTEETTKIKNQIGQLQQTDPERCPLDPDSFLELIINIKTSTDKIDHAKKYTKDINGLIYLINEINPLVNAGTKRTLTCFIKRLQNGVDYTSSEDLMETE